MLKLPQLGNISGGKNRVRLSRTGQFLPPPPPPPEQSPLYTPAFFLIPLFLLSIFLNPIHCGVKYSLDKFGGGQDEPCFCWIETLDIWLKLYQTWIFVSLQQRIIVRTQTLFTKVFVAWLNLPPPPPIWFLLIYPFFNFFYEAYASYKRRFSVEYTIYIDWAWPTKYEIERRHQK